MTAAVAPEVSDAKFALTTYVAGLNLEHQRALAGAYDAACQALLGPNDVVKADGRAFKTKSAWLKLARHFSISTYVPEERVRHEQLADGTFIATVIARAVAPWGQTSENVGACATDEATGRRIITKADAIATAATRALNRAISNLVAMGEVSAEEIGDRKSESTELQWKGKPLSAYTSEELGKLRAWAVKKDPTGFAPKIEAIDALLAAREGE